MKKISLLLSILAMAVSLHGQSLSPYAPDSYVSTTANKNETQMTFFDMKFVNNKVQSFLQKQLAMSYTGPELDLNEGKGTITQKFVSKTGSKGELSFIYNVQAVQDEFLITGVKIMGSKTQVTDFHTKYWTTAMKLENPTGDDIATNTLLQDEISYYHNNDKPYIEVKNSTIPDAETFLQELKVKEAGWKEQSEEEKAAIVEEQRAKQQEADKIREAREEEVRAKQVEETTKRTKQDELARKRDSVVSGKEKLIQAREAQQQSLNTERNKRQQLKNVNDAKARQQAQELKRAKADTIRNTFEKRLIFEVESKNNELTTNVKTGTENSKVQDLIKASLTEYMKDKKNGKYVILAQYKKVYDNVQGLKFAIRGFTKPEAALLINAEKAGTGN